MPKTALLVALASLLGIAPEPPGALLTSGMQLVYEADGKENPPWTVESVKDTTIAGVTTCRAMVIRMDATRPPERRNWCTRGDSLLAWDAAAQAFRALRPLAEGMRVVVQGARGTMSRYSTRAAQEQIISGMQFNVVQTVVVTDDSSGKLIRRLREFYAPGLATATSGVFEVPDTTQPGGFRIQTSFKLVRIVR
jgi:hypothetical protein